MSQKGVRTEAAIWALSAPPLKRGEREPGPKEAAGPGACRPGTPARESGRHSRRLVRNSGGLSEPCSGHLVLLDGGASPWGQATHCSLEAWGQIAGLRARCQPRRPPVLSLPTVREGRQLAGGVGLPPGPLGSPPPWPPYSLSLGWAAEVARPLEPPAWLCGQGALSPPWGRCLSQRERVRPVLPLPRADPGPQGPRFPP